MSETFLSRWARRKEAVRAERPETPPAAPEADGAQALPGPDHTSAGAVPPRVDAEPEGAPLAELPSLETLTAQSDLTAFLRAGVPAPLRNAALRRMWSLDPSIRDFVSEAREYAYDWNTPGGVPGLGPLLPSDNVQAMLDRLVGGVPPKDEAPTEEVQEEPTSPAEEPGETAVAALPDAPAPPVLETQSAATGPRPIERLHGSVEAFAITVPEPASTPPERPRLRRHGGAMPV